MEKNTTFFHALLLVWRVKCMEKTALFQSLLLVWGVKCMGEKKTSICSVTIAGLGV